MISAPGLSISSVRLHVCACTRVCDASYWRSLVQSPPTGENSPSESENTTFSGVQFFFSSFLAVSGLVFTGCFICLIYVPCPDCSMGPACSSHMAVPHALMRCPISRNTNRVLSPSLWLYDVWTHKSFPETADLGRSNPDQPWGPSVYFWEGLFSVTWLTPEPYIRKRGCKTEGTGTFFPTFSDSAFYFLAGNFTAKQYWLRLHTGIVFVSCYNELIEHQEVLGTIRASYKSSAITLQIGSSLLSRS